MQLDAILDLWRKDSEIGLELTTESLKIPKLHHKYYSIFIEERLLLLKLQAELKRLERDKTEYYAGTMAEEDLNERKWKPWALKVLKSDIPSYIESDNEVIDLNLRIGYQKEKIDLLDSIIRTVGNRGFQIKNAIDFMRFQSGG